MPRIKQKILIVCHDAGGAEMVSAYVKKNLAKNSFSCLALGPARIIFKRKGLGRYLIANLQRVKNIMSQMSPQDLVLTGTSWAAAVEVECIQMAKRRGLKTAAYLDHWTNYRERFGYPHQRWHEYLPDEIWVGDKFALALAKKYFKSTKYKLVPNLYWQEVVAEYKKLKGIYRKADNILFMSEPITLRDKSLNEIVILEKVLDYLSERKINNVIIVCNHPAEPKNKYSRLLARYKNKLSFAQPSKDRLRDFAQAKLVIGMKSMALVIASLCGRKTVSFIPDTSVKCLSPFREIIKIHDVRQLGKIIC